MDSKFIEIEYIDTRPIIIPRLKAYHEGMGLPKKDGNNIIKVTEQERRSLMRVKNGNKECWRDVEKISKRKVIDEVIEDVEE